MTVDQVVIIDSEQIEVFEALPDQVVISDFGPQGIAGPAGPAGGEPYVWDQAIPASTWTIPHNLGRFPSITVVDSSHAVVEGEYEYVDGNNIVLTFSAAFSGTAYLN